MKSFAQSILLAIPQTDSYGDLKIDYHKQIIFVKEKICPLRPPEYKVMECLFLNKDRNYCANEDLAFHIFPQREASLHPPLSMHRLVSVLIIKTQKKLAKGYPTKYIQKIWNNYARPPVAVRLTRPGEFQENTHQIL